MADNAITVAPSPNPDRPQWVRQLDGFTQSSSFRQLLILVALAAAISFMVGFFLWGQKGSMVPLYSQLDPSEASSITQALDAAKQTYKLSPDGTILVPPDQVPKIRMELAAKGLPSGNAVGLEMLNKDQSLGTSEFVEHARYQHAIEVELGRSIETIQAVRAARVHLAVPKPSVFVRDRQPATASVAVEVAPGQGLSDEQVKSIVHLVASSVSGLSPDNVTVVDQFGNLLSQNDDDTSGMGLTDRQFAYRQKVEQAYARRIESLLAPIVGAGKVRAQVSAGIDFSRQEGTTENYGPKQGVLVSEQATENVRSLGAQGGSGGVPGALTNQPPGGGTTTPQTNSGLQAPQNLNVQQYQQIVQTPVNTQKNQTRNYNVDKSIRHTQYASGVVDKLNVAVLLDEKTAKDANGKLKPQPMSDAELARVRDLVSQAVGLDEKRGDKLSVVSVPFVEQKIEPKTVPIWSQPWFWPTLKNVGLGIAMLLIFFMVVRPLMRILRETREQAAEAAALSAQPATAGNLPGQAMPTEYSEDGVHATLSEQKREDELDENVPMLVGNASYTDKLKSLRQSVNHDPKAVASVIKQWTNAES